MLGQHLSCKLGVIQSRVPTLITDWVFDQEIIDRLNFFPLFTFDPPELPVFCGLSVFW